MKDDESLLWADSSIAPFTPAELRAYLDGRLTAAQILRYWKHVAALLTQTYRSIQSSDGKTIGEQDLLRRIKFWIQSQEGLPSGGPNAPARAAIAPVAQNQCCVHQQEEIRQVLEALQTTLRSMNSSSADSTRILAMEQTLQALQARLATTPLSPQPGSAPTITRASILQELAQELRSTAVPSPELQPLVSQIRGPLTEDLAAANAEIARLTGALTTKDGALATKDGELAALRARIAALETNVGVTNVDALRAANAQLTTDLQTARTECNAQITALGAEHQAQLEQVRQELGQQCEERVAPMGLRIAELEQREAGQLGEIASLREQLAVSGDNAQGLRQQLTTIQNETQAQLASFQTGRNRNVTARDEAIATLNAQFTAAREAAETANAALAALQEAQPALQGRIASLGAELAQAQASLQALREENVATEETVGATRQAQDARIAELEEELSQAQASLQTLQEQNVTNEATVGATHQAKDARIAELEAEVANLRQQLATTAEAARKCQEDLATKNTEVSELNEVIATLNGQLGEYAGGVAKLRSEVASLQESVKRKEIEITQLRETNRAAIDQSKANMNKQHGSLITQLQSQLASAQTQKTQLETRLTQKEQDIAAHLARSAEAKAQMETMDRDIKACHAELERRREGTATLSVQLQQLVPQVTQIKAENKALRDSLDNCTSVLSSSNAVSSSGPSAENYARLEADVTRMDPRLAKRFAAVESTRSSLQSPVPIIQYTRPSSPKVQMGRGTSLGVGDAPTHSNFRGHPTTETGENADLHTGAPLQSARIGGRFALLPASPLSTNRTRRSPRVSTSSTNSAGSYFPTNSSASSALGPTGSPKALMNPTYARGDAGEYEGGKRYYPRKNNTRKTRKNRK
jgi:chromosome segregation ATPase